MADMGKINNGVANHTADGFSIKRLKKWLFK